MGHAAPDEDSGRTARLGLGIVARAGREEAPDCAWAIEKEALAALRRAQGPEQQSVGLRVLGNIGGTVGARPGPGSGLASLCRAATRPPRRPAASSTTPPPNAPRERCDGRRRRERPLQTVGALGFRPLSPAMVNALRDRMTAGPIDNVRAAVVALLGNAVARYPELVAPLELVVRGDALAAGSAAARWSCPAVADRFDCLDSARSVGLELNRRHVVEV
jgi:hypothetical protein